MSTRIVIPEPVLDARDAGTLVVFVGAGISKDSPTGLPGFRDLVEKLSPEAGEDIKEDEKFLDVHLGKLEKRFRESGGSNLHQRIKEALNPPTAEPNEYHHLLPQLFRDEQSVRIVTTNQDRFLQEALSKRYPACQTYVAPALPAADDFSGLVHLHGSVLDKPERMVFTDRDFSRAYLTEGWGRRFLLKLFEKYTVLLIGYSHSDTVLRYLVRGLPVGESLPARYALVEREEGSDEEEWRHGGFYPIFYDGPGGNGGSHENLLAGLRTWAADVSSGLADRRARVERIARGRPVELGDDVDFLKRSLKDADFVAPFVKEARDPKWAAWLDKEGFLTPLFSQEEIKDETARRSAGDWAGWLAELGVAGGSPEVFAFLQTRINLWHPILWFEIARCLHATDDLPDEQFNQWVMALIAAPIPHGATFEFLGYALAKCSAEERQASAIALFEVLSRPTAKRMRPYHSSDEEITSWDDIRWDVSFVEDDYWLARAWKEIFSPWMDRYAERILVVAEANLLRAYDILKLNTNWPDSFDYRRADIGDSDEDDARRFNGVVDVLIDAVRDSLLWVMNRRSAMGLETVKRYLGLRAGLFRRIALHVLSESENLLAPDEMIDLLVACDLPSPHNEFPETEAVVRKVYPLASEEGRVRLMEWVDGRYTAEGDSDPKRASIKTFRLAWFHLFADVAPDSVETARRWSHESEGIPKEDIPTGIPRRRKKISATRWSPKSPWNDDDLSSMTNESLFDAYERLPDEELFNKQADKRGVESQIRSVTTKNVDFGLGIAQTLVKREAWSHRFWGELLWGLRDALPTAEQWLKIVNLLEPRPPVLLNNPRDVAELIKSSVADERKRIPFPLLPRFEALADRLWANMKEDHEGNGAFKDRLNEAITSAAGILTQFWLHAVWWRQAESGNDWRGLTEDYRKRFEGIIRGSAYRDRMGQVILAEQLPFLSSVDQPWCATALPPLFDFERDEETAFDVWGAFLYNAHVSPPVIELLRPSLPRLLDHLDRLDANPKRGLSKFVAVWAYRDAETWRDEGWLDRFVTNADDETLSEFTRILGSGWHHSDEDFRRQSWDTWVKGYFERRCKGIPKPFSSSETVSLAGWVIPFEFMAGDFVDAVTGLPTPDVEHSILFRDLVDSPLPETAPVAILKLIGWGLQNAQNGAFGKGGEVLKIVERLFSAGLSKQDVREALEAPCHRLNLQGVFDLLKEEAPS
jgi:hypothetical protein